MQVEFIPSVCKGKNPKYIGKITFRTLTLEEKLEMLNSDFFKDVVEAQEKAAESKAAGLENIKFVLEMIKILKPRIVNIDLRRLEDGETFSTYDEMGEDDDCHGILIEAASEYMKYINLGNAKRPRSSSK